jgi:PadR family transcriptional regulator, regulatory protein PadR
MDFHQCPCSGKTLARLVQPAVMALLAGQRLHGYLLVQRLAALRMFRGQKPDPTGVYRILKAMEKQGFVESSWELADSGPAKRCFALTAAGRHCLQLWERTLKDYEASVADLLGVIHQGARRRRGTSRIPAKGACACS